MAPPRQAMRLSYSSWSAKEKEQYFHLQRNALVKGTLWLDEGMMSRMGISNQVKQLLGNMDLERLFEMRYPSYTQQTLQCLATLDFHKGNDYETSLGYITFKIRDEAYVLSTKDLCRVYGFDRRKNKVWFRYGLDASKLWRTVAFGDYVEDETTITKIRNPWTVTLCSTTTLYSCG